MTNSDGAESSETSPDDLRLYDAVWSPARRNRKSGRFALSAAFESPYVAIAADSLLIMLVLLGVTKLVASFNNWVASEEETYLMLSLVSLPAWLIVFQSQGMFNDRVDVRMVEDVRRVVRSAFMGAMAMILVSWPLQVPVSRAWLAIALVTLIPSLLLERQVLRLAGRRRRRAGHGLQNVIIMGTNAEALDLAITFEDPAMGSKVVGFIATDETEQRESLRFQPVIRTKNPAEAAIGFGADKVVIAATALPGPAPSAMLREFLDAGVRIELTSALTDVSATRIKPRVVGRQPMISLVPGEQLGWRAGAKRAFDFIVSGILLVFASPVIALAAIAVKLDSHGPVFFKQARVGRNGIEFNMYKIRSMVVDAEDRLDDLRDSNERDGPMFKMEADPRVTRVGRFLRKSSIDELPQLWNVVKGDMALVGPRPALASEMELWGSELMSRLRVRPGITGMWQVNGRGSESFEEYERLDLFYIDNWSIMTDLAIILRTVPAVIARRGAA